MTAPIPLAVRARRRRDVRALVTGCTHCPLHANARPHPLPFAGPVRPAFIVLGEAPDRTAQRRQVHFTGLHGKVLRRMLTAAHIPLDQALLVYTVCCNPFGAPERGHVDACRLNLLAQLELAEPDTPLLAVGQTALESLIPDARMTRLQGHALIAGQRPLVPMFHPAYLQRDPTARPAMEEALARFRALLSGLGPEWFLAMTCSLCAEPAEVWDERQMPYCRRHKGEVRRAKTRAARRRTNQNRAAQQRMELP